MLNLLNRLHGYRANARLGVGWESEPRPSCTRTGTEPWLAFARDCSALLGFARLLPGRFFSGAAGVPGKSPAVPRWSARFRSVYGGRQRYRLTVRQDAWRHAASRPP